MFPNRNGYQVYQRNKYETASPHKLILMLYEGAIRYSQQAIVAINKNDIKESNRLLQKVQDIIYELVATLNHDSGGSLAANLQNIYMYIIDILVKANINKDIVHIEESITLLTEIKQAWEELGKEVSINNG
ncbi:flagellar export chaperone FliS [Paenibacillus yanchengensis]|uniref:Flagellar secretion chaperone FliS n=1 Tax=Paenibacillus yanchengensis TaxID=2035833 RepID=A0ABW4YMR9_9BACL